jgi:isopenicillin N synthase-like dioxygenase
MDQITLSLLQNSGVATLVLPDSLAEIHRDSFQITKLALQKCQSFQSSSAAAASPSPIPWIDPQHSNSATVTGYHASGEENGMGRYNIYREGFVFSNGELFHLEVDTHNGSSGDDVDGGHDHRLGFETQMGQMFDPMCRVIGKSVLRGIARYLKIDEDWFESQYGSMENTSQWHLKRFVEPSFRLQEMDAGRRVCSEVANGDKDDDGEGEGEGEGDEEVIEWLPVHTDPSLISVIIHDAPGMNVGAMGLEYQTSSPISDTSQAKKRIWKEVESHGHAIATIFCGSLMSYITGGLFQSAKHRVVYSKNRQEDSLGEEMECPNSRRRMAATLFMRPRGDCYLTVPPSDILTERMVKIRKNCKFEDWIQRVSRNYQHGKKDKRKKVANGDESLKETKVMETAVDSDKMMESNVKNSDPFYWADEYTELTLHGCNPSLEGKEKYLGGELCMLNNHIYTIPGFARRIMDMDVSVEPPKLELFGPDLPGEYKWLRGIPIGDTIYGITCHSDAVLKINASTKEVTLLRWDENLPGACPRDQKWKYHGAAVSDYDGCRYCIPQAAEHVMIINPITHQISFIGPSFPGVNKWYGGLLLSDGGIYGICQNARGILRIDPKSQSCTVHGDFPQGHYKWHGAVKHTDGNLYCIPAHADQVLKVEPGIEPKLSLLGENLKTGAHRNDGKYKFLGGAVSGDCVYFFPSDADYVCEVNTKTGKVSHCCVFSKWFYSWVMLFLPCLTRTVL